MHKGPAKAHSFYFVKTHHYPATKMVITVLLRIMQTIYKQYQKTILCISSHSFSEDLSVPEVALKATGQANEPLLMLNTRVNHSVCDHSSSKSKHANSHLCLWTRLLHHLQHHIHLGNNELAMTGSRRCLWHHWTAFHQLLGSRIAVTPLSPLVKRESILKVTFGASGLAFYWWTGDNQR